MSSFFKCGAVMSNDPTPVFMFNNIIKLILDFKMNKLHVFHLVWHLER